MAPLDTKQSPEIDEMGFIITNIFELAELPGKWIFEVLTIKRTHLARFIYRSEIEADRAAKEFAWLMGKISSACRVAKTVAEHSPQEGGPARVIQRAQESARIALE
jgi:hypothetical protein